MTRSSSLKTAIVSDTILPFVYCYPPRSAYRAEDRPGSIFEVWERDLAVSGSDLNIYLHIPFCPYRCGFCNLYTVAGAPSDLLSEYTAAIAMQIEQLAPIIQTRRLKTLYIGGGTPTILGSARLASIFTALSRVYPLWRLSCEEVAIEATPESLTEDRDLAIKLVKSGVTRINVGAQSFDAAELQEASRGRAGASVLKMAFGLVRDAGIANLSTDLIIGFNRQTDQSWDASVEQVLEIRPNTISTYFLTVRPDARFGKSDSYASRNNRVFYERYDRARRRLLDAGYVQETNVRYVLPGSGGYRQKVHQFRGSPVLGIGAGARSYTNTHDYIVGGSPTPRADQIANYVECAKSGEIVPTAGYRLDHNERLRKRVALDTFDLDVSKELPSADELCAASIKSLLDEAVEAELLRRLSEFRYQALPNGFKYRDLISWGAFSDCVSSRDAAFYSSLDQKSALRGTAMGGSDLT